MKRKIVYQQEMTDPYARDAVRSAPPFTAQHAIHGYTCTVPDDCETLHWRGQILSLNELASVAQPAVGEEIHVHIEGQDVLTLPLASSGMDAPQFVVHVPGAEQPAAHPAITHCDNCGCDWLDNGLNPIGCPYCKQNAWRETFVAERAVRYCEGGMAIKQARIHAETDATLMDRLHAIKETSA